MGTPIAARNRHNFFELGGHSLPVLQMIDMIRRVFELELPVRSVFDEPTIDGLAGELQKAQALGLKARVPVLRSAVPAEGLFWLSSASYRQMRRRI